MSRFPRLDEIERRPDSGSLRERGGAAFWADNREPSTRGWVSALGSGDCWCGEPYKHDWAGKAAGVPHPRAAEVLCA